VGFGGIKMSQYITLGHIDVEYANAVAGITYGFPSVTNFLGFVHALSRKLEEKRGVTLGGCVIVCHDFQLHTYQADSYKYSDYYFSQTKNPSSGRYQSASKGNPPPVIEEGKMHMNVSLVIECNGFDKGGVEEIKEFEKYVKNLALRHRLAGGRIIGIADSRLETIIDDKGFRKIRHRLLPGFVLKERNEYLQEHLSKLQEDNSDADMLEAWLDFCSIKYKAEPILEDGEKLSEKTKAVWNRIEKPNKGYLVPLMVGYQAIDRLYEAGEVDNVRDPTVPFCFVEAIYGIGEWLSPHRLESLEEVLWRYKYEDGYYLTTQEAYECSEDEIDDISEILEFM
jgi:CRISPR-associated protein Csy2